MNMCENYLIKTYLKISGAGSCECIGIAECIRYNRESFSRVLGKTLVIWWSQVGRGYIAFNKPQDSDYDREHEEDKNKDNELQGCKWQIEDSMSELWV